MVNPRTINLSQSDMAALARRDIIGMPTHIPPSVSKVCREMMMETARKIGIAPTLRFRSMLYSSFGAIASAKTDPELLIKQATTQAVREYFNGTR